MRTLLAALALSASALAAPAALAEDGAYAAEAGDARLAAVLSYADWCGSCRVLDPKINAVREASGFDGVAFVRLDYTQRSDDAYFAAADAAGVGEAVRAKFNAGIKTGMVLLIDIDDAEIVGEIRRDDSEEAITDAIEAAAAEA